MTAEVLIVPTGTANLASVMAAFRRLGAAPRLAGDPGEILDAPLVMVPGVGTFGAAMDALRRRGFDRALRERIGADRPTLAICVGHQLLFARSEESPGVQGIGAIDAEVTRYEPGVRVPQFGWNEVRVGPEAGLVAGGWAYFANSYRATAAPGCAVGTAEHGGGFVAAVERGGLIGCQFHPELSGAYGAALLARFLGLARC